MPANDPRTVVPARYRNLWPARHRRVYSQSRYPRINAVLAEDTTLIQYDVRRSPSHSLLRTVPQLSDTPAFTSVSPTIRIISPSFPWSVDIPAPVSCAAVFEELYKMLQKSVTDSEWGYICGGSRYKSIMRAAKARMGRDKVTQVKRIDWLGDKTTFKGLQLDREFEKKRLLPGMTPCSETWVVKFKKP
ncbi:hypothetical protein EDC04DRAFT_2676003 [Pisolithus marmoratus]|nr:hypothetical protein EDC04DRAFT_2676003 [Pisolithus marmoratus]